MSANESPSPLGAWLDPVEVLRLGPIDFAARELVDGFLRGLHRSPKRGSSSEFAEHRAYAPGDPVQRIDWRSYARTDRYYLREYDDETNVRCDLVLDASASMAHPDGPVSKFRYGRFLVAALAYLLHRQRDAVGLTILDRGVRGRLPPKSTAEHLNGLLHVLETTEPQGTTELGRGLEAVASTMRRGLVVVVSDFLVDLDAALRAIAQLRHRGSDVIAFHLLDPAEEQLPFAGWTIFRDPERPAATVRYDARQVRAIYQDKLLAHREGLARGCRSAGVDYALVRTSTPFEQSLSSFLERRQRLPA